MSKFGLQADEHRTNFGSPIAAWSPGSSVAAAPPPSTAAVPSILPTPQRPAVPSQQQRRFWRALAMPGLD